MVKYYLWFEMLLRELLNRNERHVQGRLRSDIISLVATTQTVLLHHIVRKRLIFRKSYLFSASKQVWNQIRDFHLHHKRPADLKDLFEVSFW